MPVISTFSGGGGGSGGPRLDKAYYNFPLSIGPDFPAPVTDGHVYVQLDAEQAAQITRVYIDSAVRVSHEDGSLILVCQNRDTYLSIQEVRKVDGREVIVSALINADAQSNGWQAGYNADANNIRKALPMVYAKLGGVVEMQTAWVYRGDKWVQLSVKGQYLMLSSSSANSSVINVYNWDGDQAFAKNDAFPAPSFPVASAGISPDARFIFYLSAQSPYLFGYRRIGETWEQLPTINYNARAPHTWLSQHQLRGIAFSPSGHHMAVSVDGGVDIYKRSADGGTYELATKITDIAVAMSFAYTSDGSALYVGANDRAVYCYEIAGDTYTRVSGAFLPSGIAQTTSNFPAGIAISPDGKHMVITYYNTSTTNITSRGYSTTGGAIWAHLRNGRIPVQTAILSFIPTMSDATYSAISVRDTAISPDGKYVFWCSRVTNTAANNKAGYGLCMAKVEDDNVVIEEKQADNLTTASICSYNSWVSLSQDGRRAFLIYQNGAFAKLVEIDYDSMTVTPLSGETIPDNRGANHAQFVPYNTIMQ